MIRHKSIDGATHQPTGTSAPTPYVWFEHRPRFLALVLAVVTFAAYQAVCHAGFIWDDDDHLTARRAQGSPDR